MRVVRRAGRRVQAVVVEARDDSLAEPLKALPASTGLFVFNDEWAHQVVRIARSLGIAIPRDVAVVGVDNDEMASAFAPAPLTSVDPDFEAVGYEAAVWLDRMFEGEAPPEAPIRMPPRGLIERGSSDYPAQADELAVQAARLIRRRACDGLTVEQIPDFLPATYWTINRRFQAAFGRTLHEQIIATRLDEAARLLRTTRLPVIEVCERVGFGNVKHFSTVFRRRVGQSPASYRRAHRAGRG
jgi:LacI family transcriptional regulator